MNSEQYRDNESFMDLPPVQPPAAEQGQAPAEAVEKLGTERNPELDVKGQSATSPQSASTATPAQAQIADDAAAPVAVPPAAMPSMADDSDLIEKEWVEKARDIINRTKADPHEQSKELGKVKSEYLKMRFNKQPSTGKNGAK